MLARNGTGRHGSWLAAAVAVVAAALSAAPAGAISDVNERLGRQAAVLADRMESLADDVGGAFGETPAATGAIIAIMDARDALLRVVAAPLDKEAPLRAITASAVALTRVEALLPYVEDGSARSLLGAYAAAREADAKLVRLADGSV